MFSNENKIEALTQEIEKLSNFLSVKADEIES